jgi:hypothetical protein
MLAAEPEDMAVADAAVEDRAALRVVLAEGLGDAAVDAFLAGPAFGHAPAPVLVRVFDAKSAYVCGHDADCVRVL